MKNKYVKKLDVLEMIEDTFEIEANCENDWTWNRALKCVFDNLLYGIDGVELEQGDGFMSVKEFTIITLLDKYEHLDDDTAAEVVKTRTGATDEEIAAAMMKAVAVYDSIAESEAGMMDEILEEDKMDD